MIMLRQSVAVSVVILESQHDTHCQTCHLQQIDIESFVIEDVFPDIRSDVKEVSGYEDQDVLFYHIWNSMWVQTYPNSY